MMTKKSKTIKIRIAVAVDDSGNWGAAGWKGSKDAEAMETARENAEAADGLSGAEQHYYLAIEVPLPRALELAGAVIESEEVTDDNREEAA